MEFTATQKKFITTFSEEIINGDAAIFAGAGLSAASGFVNWKGLLKDIAEEIGLDIEKEHDLVSVAQYHFNKKKRGVLNNKIINEFTTLRSGNENHQVLSRLGIDTFWTTNYDQLIESTLIGHGKTVERKIRNNDFSRNIKKRDAIVYKMHGDKDSPDEAVIIKDDYETYNDKRSFFTTTLQGDLLSKTFLFLGFSFDDPNLDYVLARIKILLQDNTPTHYCFFKTVNEGDFTFANKSAEENHSDFLYAKIKQELKIEDLMRYGIHAILIDDYKEITTILLEIEKRRKRKNIFISGAAHTYDPYSNEDAMDLIHSLSYQLASKQYKIISGYGLGIGSIVINGALEYRINNSAYRWLDDSLILRPFPQLISGGSSKEELWSAYRKNMIIDAGAGIAIFLFGNKVDANGDLLLSDGMAEEFDICIKNGIVPLPVGATGYISEDLWKDVQKNIKTYYPDNKDLVDAFIEIGKKGTTKDDLITNILKAVNVLQKI